MGLPFPDRPRRCVACRQLRPRGEMLAVTVSAADERFALDHVPPIQGRSAYVCRSAACMAPALKGRKLQKALKRAIPDAILENLHSLLERLSGVEPASPAGPDFPVPVEPRP